MIRFHTTVRKNICYDLFVSRQVVKNATISLFFKKRQILAYGHTKIFLKFSSATVCALSSRANLLLRFPSENWKKNW